MRITILILALYVATAVQAQTDTVRHKIRTLPVIKLGESDPRAKALPHFKPASRKPPAVDPYQWITAPEIETAGTNQWTMASGTNITATLVKSNRFTVVFKMDDDTEVSIARPALDKAGKTIVAKIEAEIEVARIEEWKKAQEEKSVQ